jgi:hypothetical protein
VGGIKVGLQRNEISKLTWVVDFGREGKAIHEGGCQYWIQGIHQLQLWITNNNRLDQQQDVVTYCTTNMN